MIKKLSLFLVAIFAMVYLQGCGYNTMVSESETVDGAWSQVENQYQRRSDLVPMLVNTVSGAANFEKQTLTDVIEARSKATQVQLNPGDLSDPQKFQAFQRAQDGLSTMLSRLMVTVEKYPELKANQNFLNLQSQIEGTENRIAIERMKFNEAVKKYNVTIKSFPQNIMANIFGFKNKEFFKSTEGSNKAPEVKFDFNKKEEKK